MKSKWTTRVAGRGLEWNREMPHHIPLFMGGGVEGCREEPSHRQAQRRSLRHSCSIPLSLSFSPSRAFAKGNGEENEIEPGLRHQRLRRYQIPRTALSRAFTPDDVVVPSLRSCFLRRSIKFPGRNRIVFSTPCCVLHRTRPEALHYHIISSSLADYRRQERHVCACAFAYPVPEVDSESVFP